MKLSQTLDTMASLLVLNDVMGISEDKEGYDATKYTGSNGKLKAVIHFPKKLEFNGDLHYMN